MSEQHIPTPDMQPDLSEVQQVEDHEYQVVPVKVCGPTETRELPTKRIAIRSVTVDTSVGVRLLTSDPRRKSASIISKAQDIRLGANQAQAQLSGTWWPMAVALPVTTIAELWAIADSATTDISIIEEYWG